MSAKPIIDLSFETAAAEEKQPYPSHKVVDAQKEYHVPPTSKLEFV